MGISKTQEFTLDEVRTAEFCRVLSSPSRIAILKCIADKRACICGDLVLELPLSQSTISQHLKELKSIGLIQGEIDGPKMNYCINPIIWDEMRSSLNQFMKIADKLNACSTKC
ncbi:MAG: transcriptional regulator [Leptospira sp.]|nr:MAG: transcriptional regulator [Leptospira sp.]